MPAFAPPHAPEASALFTVEPGERRRDRLLRAIDRLRTGRGIPPGHSV